MWHLESAPYSTVIATLRISGFAFDRMRCMLNAAASRLASTSSVAASDAAIVEASDLAIEHGHNRSSDPTIDRGENCKFAEETRKIKP